MPREAKGYPKQEMVYELYEKEIDGLYHKEEVRLKALDDEDGTKEAKADAHFIEN